jgi:hypothetical protein
VCSKDYEIEIERFFDTVAMPVFLPQAGCSDLYDDGASIEVSQNRT